jgi:LmbE family N-acetylglucosaminyl deacetylase
MRSLSLSCNPTLPLNVLCLGAHSDDIEIGCGGTILHLSEHYPNCAIHWVVFSALGVRAAEAEKSAALFAGKSMASGPVLKRFQDGFMPFAGAEVKTTFEELKSIAPDLIFTHNPNDAHQDHRLIAELTWNTFRDHLILEYEIPKYDGDMGRPSVFVPLESEVCEKKVRCLTEAFQSQHTKRWFRRDTFLALLRLRGMECNAPSGYAEAFYCRKLVL